MKHTVKDILKYLKNNDYVVLYIAGVSLKTYNPVESRIFTRDRSLFYSYCRPIKGIKVFITKPEIKRKSTYRSQYAHLIDIFKIAIDGETVLKSKIGFAEEYKFFDTLAEAEKFYEKERVRATKIFSESKEEFRNPFYESKVNSFIKKLN